MALTDKWEETKMYKTIKARYNKGYIRLDQLKRYCALGVISEDEFMDICGKNFKILIVY